MRDFLRGLTFIVFTALTLTLNVFSTAAFIWILLACGATSKVYCPYSIRIVFFSVMSGRRMTSSSLISATICLLCLLADCVPRLRPNTRLPLVGGQRPNLLDHLDRRLHDDQALIFQDVPHVQIAGQNPVHVLEVAGCAHDRFQLFGN